MDVIKNFWEKIKEFVKGSVIAQIVIVILILLLVYWLYKKFFVSTVNTQSAAEKVAQQEQSKPTTGAGQATTNLADQARNLSIHLGTNKDLRWWETQTENDLGVFNILKSMSLADFKTVSEVYRQVFTTNRDLKADVIRFLDDEYLEQLSHLFGGTQVGGFFTASLNSSDTLTKSL